MSSLPEVVGDAALITDPFDPKPLQTNILALRDPNLRQELKAGLERAKLFSWDRMVSELADFVGTMG